MEETDWDSYGTGNYEKCADCMVHCGFEATAVKDSVTRPWKAMKVAFKGVRTEGDMAPEIPLDNQRPAEFVFSSHVQDVMEKMAHDAPATRRPGSKSDARAQATAAGD